MVMVFGQENPSRPNWGIASPRQTTDFAQDTSLRDRVEKSFWTSLAWCRRLHNSVDNDNVLF
jgi:hypothetical protein